MIGDFGTDDENEGAVAAMVAAWNPDDDIGKYYADFIHPYQGDYGAGADHNRFWPCMGNHDWDDSDGAAYLDVFELPGNERYYDVVLGPMHLFCVDSDIREPDGVEVDSVQAAWLQGALAVSTAPWQVVVLHHPPYSSGRHGDTEPVQWPYRAWGADLVLSGHDHDYERLLVGGLPYVVNGAGGAPANDLEARTEGSEVGWGSVYGAQLVRIDPDWATSTFYDTGGHVLDRFTVGAGHPMAAEIALVPEGASWRYLEDAAGPGEGRRSGLAVRTSPWFNDLPWEEGPAPLGYGEDDVVTQVEPGEPQRITTWFRHTFTVDDPAALRSVLLRLRRDDGAVVYLNEAEVVRSNMPKGAIALDTEALEATSDTDEDAFFSYVIDPAHLVAGDNAVAVEVHQASETSSDVVFDLELTAETGDWLVRSGDSWRYLDDGVGPGSAWQEPGFDDGGWGQGIGPLGYNGDVATIVSYGGNDLARHITTWFRHTFEVDDPDAWRALVLTLSRDDGALVWLNGVEVARSNLPEAAVGPSTPAVGEVSDWFETAWTSTAVDARHLRPGTNVLAVEVHLESASSTDLRMDAELLALP